MKRILACLLILVMIFAFAACNNDTEESKPSDESSTALVNSGDDTSTPADESKPEESSTAPDDSSEPVEESSDVTPPPPPVREEAEVPSNYIWLSNAEGETDGTAFGWKIDAAAFNGKSDIRIFADVMFEDVVSVNDGLAFVNIYFYGESGNLLDFEDWASSREVSEDEMGKWYSYEYYFEIPNIETDDDKLAYVTVTIGFWNAYGKIYCGPINISAQKEMFWSKSFITYPDLSESDICTAVKVTDENSGLTWDVVFEAQESVGTNLAAEEGASLVLVKGEVVGTTDELKLNDDTPYGGSLNDGICGAGELGDSSWFGFHGNKTLESGKSIDDQSGQMGIAIIDLGSEQEFNRVRAFHWSPNEWGIASLIASRAYYSNDGEEWTEYSDLLINSEDKVGWADTDVLATVSARYVKVELLFSSGAWGMIGEIEVISAKQDVVE